MRVVEGGKFQGHAAVLCHSLAVDEHLEHFHGLQVFQQHNVRALARGDRAHFVIQLETLGAVDGDHLDGRDGIDALFQSPAENVVYVALGHQGVGVFVVGNQHCEPGVDLLLGDTLSHFMKVPPSGALPEHGVHP